MRKSPAGGIEFPLLSWKNQHCLLPVLLFQEEQDAAAVLSFGSAPSSHRNLWVPEILEEAPAASCMLLPNGGGFGFFFFHSWCRWCSYFK